MARENLKRAAEAVGKARLALSRLHDSEQGALMKVAQRDPRTGAVWELIEPTWPVRGLVAGGTGFFRVNHAGDMLEALERWAATHLI